MKWTAADKWLLAISVIAGAAVWVLFAVFETEPWDSAYGWIVLAGSGLVAGFLGKRNPVFWPLGILLGEVLFGLGSLARSVFFYSGGGANFFFPLGLMFLVPFTLPALIGSFVGFGVRKAFGRKRGPDAKKPRAG